MAEAAAESATNSHVRWLAGTIVRNQRREIREIETMITMLRGGATVSGATVRGSTVRGSTVSGSTVSGSTSSR